MRWLVLLALPALLMAPMDPVRAGPSHHFNARRLRSHHVLRRRPRPAWARVFSLSDAEKTVFLAPTAAKAPGFTPPRPVRRNWPADWEQRVALPWGFRT